MRKRYMRKAVNRITAVSLALVLAATGLVVLFVSNVEVTRAASPGTGPYYGERRDEAFEKVGWVPPGTPCMDANGASAVTVATASISNFTYDTETIPGIPNASPLHGGGPWTLDLPHTTGQTPGCSMPWNGAATMPATTQMDGGVSCYLVYTAEEFRYCVMNRQSFKLMKDIDLGGYLGRNWATPTSATTLTLANGNGHTVYNYYMYDTLATASVGPKSLFGPSNNITIRNLRVSNSYSHIAGNVRYLGLFTSYAGSASVRIENCAAVKSVLYMQTTDNGTGYGAAAFVVNGNSNIVDNCYTDDVHIMVFSTCRGSCAAQIAWAGASTITNTFSINGTVIGNKGHNGGFTSCSNSDTIRNCFTDVEIYGNNDAGAFVGVHHGGTHIIENCFASGKVEGTEALGGFMGAPDANGTITGSRITNAYSSAMVGMRSNARKQGSFLGSWKGIVNLSTNSRDYTLTNCYATGEVGALDLDSSLGRGNSTNAGFTGAPNASIKYSHCYYDKQTTGMKEWALGGPRDASDLTSNFPGTPSPGYESDTCQAQGASWDVKGVLTTDTQKSGTGLTSQPGSNPVLGTTDQSFTGFTNDSEWVFEAGHYPQLRVFADPTTFTNTNWLTQDEMNNLVKAYSRASTSTITFETYDEDHAGNPLNRVTGHPDVYDTVRDITRDFTMTSDYDTKWARVGNGPTLANGKGNSSAIPNQGVFPVVELNHPIPVYGAGYKTTGLAPGIEWLRPTVLRGNQEGTRALRAVPLSRLYAGPSESINTGDYYDHKPGVRFAFTTGPEYNLSQPVLHAETFPGTTEHKDVPAPIVQGSLVSYTIRPVTGTNPDGSYILGPELDLDDDGINHQFNGLAPFTMDKGIYAITYTWEFSDKRYMRDVKYVSHNKIIEAEKNAYINDSEDPQNGDEAEYEPVSEGDEILYEITVNNLGFELMAVPVFLAPTTNGHLDIAMDNSVGGAAALVNEIVTFTIKVENVSSVGVCDVGISSDIPTGMDFVENSIEIDGLPSGGDGYFNHNTGIVHCLIGNIASGASSVITYQAKVNGVFIAENLKFATQAHAVYMEDGTGNSTVYNQNSPPTEFDIAGQSGSVTDMLPPGLTYLDHDASGAVFTRDGQECKWEWAAMPVGKTKVWVKVRVDGTGIFVNTATIKDNLFYPEGQPTNTTYHEMRQRLLHVRQVVLGSVAGVDLPLMGYLLLANNSLTLPATCFSGPGGSSVNYTSYTLLPNEDPEYLVRLTVPQNYKFVGHFQNDGEVAAAGHNDPTVLPAPANGLIKLGYRATGEIWLTLYITPHGDPRDYSNSYATNNFGRIYETVLPPDAPFSVGKPLYFIAQGVNYVSGAPTKTQLYFIQNVGDGAGELIEIGEPVDARYNSMGFHSGSMLLYALKVNSNELIQIGRGGAVTDMGAVAGLPVKGYNAADFGEGAYSDILFVRVGVNTAPDTQYMWLVDINSMSSTRLTLSTAIPNTADVFFMQGYVWAMDGEQGANPRIFRINPANGQVNTYSLAGLGITAQPYGAQWKYSNNDFGISGNQVGEIYRIHIENATSANPTFSIVSKIIGPTTSQNDGASYIGLVTDSIYT